MNIGNVEMFTFTDDEGWLISRELNRRDCKKLSFEKSDNSNKDQIHELHKKQKYVLKTIIC